MQGPQPPEDRPGPSRPLDRLPAALRLLAVAAPYPLALAVGSVVLAAQSPTTQARWLDGASTDLANLSAHPVSSLLLSAFVTDGDAVAWVVLALAGLAALGQRLGAWRALAVAFAVHVLATLASQGLVHHRIATGALPPSARVMTDVGPSYVVVAALVAAVVHGRWAGRVTAAVGFALLAPSIFDGLTALDVAAVGHAVCVGLAPLLAWPLVRRVARRGG